MDYQSLYQKTIVELRRLAKEEGIKVPSGLAKSAIVETIQEADKARTAAPKASDEEKQEPKAESPAEAAKPEKTAPKHVSVPRQKRPMPAAKPTEAAAEKQAEALDEKPAPVAKQEEAVVNKPAPTAEKTAAPGIARREMPRSMPRQFAAQPRSFARPAVPPANTERSGEAAPRPATPDNASEAPSEEAPARRDYIETTVEGVPIGDFADGAGLLEIQMEGHGFLRAQNCLPSDKDIYISVAQIRRFNLREGDYVEGKTRPRREGDRYSALIYINRINGEPPARAISRKPFDSLIPWYPTQRLRMESAKESDMAMRMIDLLAPIGKGQRGMIVSQPKAGKTTLLKKIANAITENNPEVKLIVLLIDERPEEVTDMKRSIQGEVIYSTFDEEPENHARVSEMILAHAQRMVEMGKDVVILLDSITRLARAYNLVIPPTGRSLSGGLDPGALNKPKKFFGAARNIENGGSLTIIATALVDTGSRMDDIIFEEFKGTGNMELHLDRKLSDRRVFPAIDILRSGTRREELLLTPEELEGAYQARNLMGNASAQQSVEQLMGLMEKTKDNAEFLQKLKGWVSVYEKDGFTMSAKQ